jgi:hypothetical protein
MNGNGHIPETLIDDWRRAQAISMPQDIKRLPDGEVPKIVAIMSCPRLGWTDNFKCAQTVFMSLGIGMLVDSGVFWGQGLSRLLKLCAEREIEYVITLDYDSIFNKEHVARLYQLMTENPDVDAIVPVQVKREANASMFTMWTDSDKFGVLSVKADEFMRPLTKIATGHFGLTIIRTSSLAKLHKPWMKAIPDLNGEWEAGHIDEDIYFWLNAMSVGWNVCLANEVRIGHLQRIITWPKPDFTPMFQYISGWQEKGQPEIEEGVWQS